MMKQDGFDPVAACRALGDATRWKLFACLRECCSEAAFEEGGGVRSVDGPTVGQICCRVTGEGRITSTLSAHLKELRLAGLIAMEKRGKFVVCSLNRPNLEKLIAFLKGDENVCC